jgi:alkylated DNA repair dioxygenase AlkB
LAQEVMTEVATELTSTSFKIERDALALEYRPDFLLPDEADRLLAVLLEGTPWQQPELVIYGKRVKVPRLTAWYGDPGATYVYSGIKNRPISWTAPLRALKGAVEAAAATHFNSVLLNLYRNGNDYMSWHRDDEPELGNSPKIASVSLGVTRRFDLRQVCSNSGQKRMTHRIELAHGSLLLMWGRTQRQWEHGIPKEPKLSEPRINLTFRMIHPGD